MSVFFFSQIFLSSASSYCILNAGADVGVGGGRLDSALQGYAKSQYNSPGGLMDEVYKYPCTCGGTPPPVAENEMRPHAHRIPDEKYAGEVCGGTIMLMVGEDNALLAYGIQGQRIAVDIMH